MAYALTGSFEKTRHGGVYGMLSICCSVPCDWTEYLWIFSLGLAYFSSSLERMVSISCSSTCSKSAVGGVSSASATTLCYLFYCLSESISFVVNSICLVGCCYLVYLTYMLPEILTNSKCLSSKIRAYYPSILKVTCLSYAKINFTSDGGTF